MMKYKTIDDFDFAGKRVLLRSDLNSEIEKGKIVMNLRVSESAKTIKELAKKKARVVVLAHQGRKGKEDFMSLEQHAKLLNKLVKIKFVDDIIGLKAVNEIKKLKDGEAILLDNIRNLDEEMNCIPNNKIIKTLAHLFDIYINDAFSVSHREQTSIVGFPAVLPSGIGRVMQRELESLEKLNADNALFVLGGAKVEEILLLLNGKRKILASGTFSILALMAKGHDFGKQGDELKKEFKNFASLKDKLENVILPVDFAVSVNGKRRNLSIDELPSEYMALDIGDETIKLFVNEIKKAKTIFMKGPAGKFEDKQFAKGTKEILKAIAASKAFSVIGGGHSSSAIEEFGINPKKFGYISLSGGALLTYLTGEKLPGLEALEKWKK